MTQIKNTDLEICDICYKQFHISDPNIMDFPNKKSICKKCFLFVHKTMSWGAEIQKKVVFDYIKVSITHEIKWKVWKRDGFKCKKCGSDEYLSVDHIRPESLGGKLVMNNLQTLCRKCNSSKGSKI